VADASPARRLVLLRHGRTAWNHEVRAQGQSDVPLDEVGHTQAAVVAGELAALGPATLWTSDLVRARDTAGYLERATGLTARLDARLREYDLGARTGQTLADYVEQHPEHASAIRQGRYDAIPGTEPTRAVVDRVCAAVREAFAGLSAGECAIVVSHGAALKVALTGLLGWPASLAGTVRGLDNCGWIVLDDSGEEGRLRLMAYNRTTDFATHEGVG
jgi:glucosyl-3-phosphoglycerate phosphatase